LKKTLNVHKICDLTFLFLKKNQIFIILA